MLPTTPPLRTQEVQYLMFGTYSSMLVFFVSLFLPPFSTNVQGAQGTGLNLLLFGWAGLFLNEFVYKIWLANPIIFFSWYYGVIKAPKTSGVLSTISFSLASCFIFVDTIATDAGGTFRKIESLDAGFWLWWISTGIPISALLLAFYNTRRAK